MYKPEDKDNDDEEGEVVDKLRWVGRLGGSYALGAILCYGTHSRGRHTIKPTYTYMIMCGVDCQAAIPRGCYIVELDQNGVEKRASAVQIHRGLKVSD